MGRKNVSDYRQGTDVVTVELATTQPVRSRLLSGFKWNALAQIARQASRTVVAIAVARLLTPAEYGLAGMALAFTGLAVLFTDVGLGVALVQRDEISEEDRCTAFWMSVAAGLLLTTLGILCAPLLADFYGEPRVAPLFAAVSVSFILIALQSTQASLLQREMNFKALEIRLIGATVFGGAVGLVAAILGAGAWALVDPATGDESRLHPACSGGRPPGGRSCCSLDVSLRSLGGFGAHVWGSRLIGFAGGNADNIIVGRMLGDSALGLYSVAFNLITLPIVRLVVPVQDTLFPVFSRLQNDRQRLAGLWLRANTLIIAIIAPAILGVALTANDLVDVVLGSRWQGVAVILQILCAFAFVACLGTLGQTVLFALGQARTVFRFSMFITFSNIAAFLIGAHWGVAGVAAAATIVTVPTQLVLLRRVARSVGTTLLAMFARARGVFEAVLAMSAAVLGMKALCTSSIGSPALTLGILILTAATVYIPICLWRAPEVGRDIRQRRNIAV